MVRGAGRELKGAVNEAAGRMAGKPGLQVKGKVQKTAGRIQRKAGEAESRMIRKRNRDVADL
jgi:uncharacterized protein YjbJ (UPF0337 family)